ncbi:murein biosynthesis integral membrane protein MurJ [Bradyrhizobium sp. 41S5]|uniref:murein biosynthesis integral membrane protein MurJ n=1 Tax=Bradyrhizobium sp. 41S5 TaxID=1404443 RepID=UPI001E2B217D|nr:murein biosynthesis integral membrane protein MurJ [Bradyrhizobium sp. 41S5]UFX44460.1 murein biosynthesis integral membrane protein MurJ [Bradyrhizobium sp. 41S5]
MAEQQDRAGQARVIGIASIIWASSIFLSRVMGLVREQIIGRTLGASRMADLYFASFTLPDFLNYLLAAGALSIVFIPIFLAHLERGDHERGWESFSVIANFIVVVGTVGIGLLMIFARPLATLVAPGFSSDGDVDTLVRLTRIILPAQFFHVIGGLLSAALQAQNLHALPAMAPLVYSAGIIIGGLIGAHYPQLGAEGFAWGVLAGSIAGPFALPLYGCMKTRMRWTALFTFRNPDLRRYLWLSVPIMIGFSIVVVDEWIVKNQASYLGAGSLSYLQYGRTLMKVPMGMFGMAAGVAAYPTISGLVAAGRIVEAYGLLCRAVRLMLLLTFAAQVCLTIAGFEAVYLIWGLFADRFTVADAQQTATVLAYLCLGLSAWAAQTVISRGFYALESTWLPTIIGTAVAIVMVPLYVVLRQQYGTVGLAIASSTSIMVYVILLGWLQRRRFEKEAAARGTRLLRGSQEMLGPVLRLAAAAAIATGLGLIARTQLLSWLPDMHLATILLRATLLCMFGIGAYLGLARFFLVTDVIEFEVKLFRKLRLG